MTALEGRTVVLGITGSVAAYKAVEVARLLLKAGARIAISNNAIERVDIVFVVDNSNSMRDNQVQLARREAPNQLDSDHHANDDTGQQIFEISTLPLPPVMPERESISGAEQRQKNTHGKRRRLSPVAGEVLRWAYGRSYLEHRQGL